MFNKLREAIALAEEAEFELEAINFILFDESFDNRIEELMENDIEELIQEQMYIYDNDPILMEDADFDEEEEIEEEEIEDDELEELLESVLEDF